MEIVEDFEREVFGRILKNVPRVNWILTEKVNWEVVGILVIGKRLVGRVDNLVYLVISVVIEMTLVTPVEAKGSVLVLMMFGFGGFLGDLSSARLGGLVGIAGCAFGLFFMQFKDLSSSE